MAVSQCQAACLEATRPARDAILLRCFTLRSTVFLMNLEPRHIMKHRDSACCLDSTQLVVDVRVWSAQMEAATYCLRPSACGQICKMLCTLSQGAFLTSAAERY